MYSGPKITMLNPEVADEDTIQATKALMNAIWENSMFIHYCVSDASDVSMDELDTTGSKHCTWEKPTPEEIKQDQLVHLILRKVSQLECSN